MRDFDEQNVRRETGVRPGRFARKPQSSPETGLLKPETLSMQVPSDIDRRRADLIASRLRIVIGIRTESRFDHVSELAGLDQELDTLDGEFDRRDGWTRYFRVVGPGGHVHRPGCPSCTETTSFELRAELSGADEEEVVTIIGKAACSICFPSAPQAPATPPNGSWRERGSAPRPAADPAPVFQDASGQTVFDQYGMAFRSEKAAERAAITGLINIVRYDNPERAPHLIRVAAEVEEVLAASRLISISVVREGWAPRLRANSADGRLGDDCLHFGQTAFDALDRYRSGERG